MSTTRTEAEAKVAELLVTAKQSLRLSVAFLSRLDGTTQHLEVVESSVPFLFREKATQRQATSLCQAIHDGKLPAVIPDLRRYPAAMRLPAARLPRIRSYVSVPVMLSDGTQYGTFCAAGLTSDKELSRRDKALMDVLAAAAAVIIEPDLAERARIAEVTSRIAPVIMDGGPSLVFQPIVEMGSRRRVGAEALTRFPAEWGLAPDVCFEQAHSIGMGDQLEVQAIARAGDQLRRFEGYMAMNISPSTLCTVEAAAVLARLPVERIVLELSEHDPVEDYRTLGAVLAPLRNQGMRLAIDDVGAGYSSLRHIVLTSPDVIKIDRSLVHGVAADPVLSTLVRSLTEFAHDCGAVVVAEGVETEADAVVLTGLGVDLGQGWLFGRPVPAAELAAQDASVG